MGRRPGMDCYELRQFAPHTCSSWESHTLTSPFNWGTQIGGALVMSTYGHPSEELARGRLKRAHAQTVTTLRVADDGSQKGRKAV